MAFSIDEMVSEITDMVRYWEQKLQEHLYEEYENIKNEVKAEIWDEISDDVDDYYSSSYNFSLISKERYKNRPSNVYFISDGEFVKIGKADNVDCRMKQLQTSNAKPLFVIGYIPCKTPSSALTKETIIHSDFKSRKMVGEWYRIEISEAIEKIKKLNGVIVKSED
jgi:hypothetical protein